MRMGGRMVDNPSKTSAHPACLVVLRITFFPWEFSRQNPRGFCSALALMAVGRCQEKRDELCVHPPQLLRLPSSRACPAARPVVTPVLGTPRFPSGVGFQVASAQGPPFHPHIPNILSARGRGEAKAKSRQQSLGCFRYYAPSTWHMAHEAVMLGHSAV